MLVVQIRIMHINALKTQLMYKNVRTNPEKFQNLTQPSCCPILTLEKKLKSRRGNGYRFVQKGEIPYRNHKACCEKLIPKPSPNGTKQITMTCRVPFHDSMPGFRNFRRVLDLLEFKN